jgi:hypothetical protein
MAAVFVRDPHSVGQGIFQDISAIMSLFINMTSFTIDTNIIADVQRTRNQCYAHNCKATLHRIEKENCLNSMIKLLKVPEILCKQSAKIALFFLFITTALLMSSSILSRILVLLLTGINVSPGD